MGLTGDGDRRHDRPPPASRRACSRSTPTGSADLDTLLAMLVEGGRDHRYSVAWVDLLARGRSLGRSVLNQGDFATLDDLPKPGRRRDDPLAYAPMATLPDARRCVPRGVLNRLTRRGVQRAVVSARRPAPARASSRRSPSSSTRSTWSSGWNRIYGPAGLPPVAVRGARSAPRTCCATVVEALSEPPRTSLPGGAQALRRGRPGPAVVPGPGLDAGARRPRRRTATSARCSTGWTTRVAEAGGRIYLAKDSRLRPELLPAMYPRLDEWRAMPRPARPGPAPGQRPGAAAQPAGLTRRRRPAKRKRPNDNEAG